MVLQHFAAFTNNSLTRAILFFLTNGHHDINILVQQSLKCIQPQISASGYTQKPWAVSILDESMITTWETLNS